MRSIATTILLLALTTAAAAAPTGGWFDMENCGMCKNLTQDAELFESMDWNNHLFANGLVEVTVVFYQCVLTSHHARAGSFAELFHHLCRDCHDLVLLGGAHAIR